LKESALQSGEIKAYSVFSSSCRRGKQRLFKGGSEMKEGVRKKIEVDKIRGPKNGSRVAIDEESIRELAQSMQSIGLIQEITVYKDNGAYVVVAGDCRFQAAKLLGWKTIDATVHEKWTPELIDIQIIENMGRKNLSPIEEAMAFEVLLTERNYSIADIVEKIGKSRPYVSGRLALIELHDDLQAKVHYGELNIASANELQRIEDPEVRESYATEIKQRGLSARVAKAWADNYEETTELVETTPTPEPDQPTYEVPGQAKGRCVLCVGQFPYVDLNVVYLCPVCQNSIIQYRDEKKAEIDGDCDNSDANPNHVDPT